MPACVAGGTMQGIVLSCLCIISHHTAAQQQAAERFELHQSLIRIAPTFSTKAKVPSIRLMMSVKLMTITCTTAEQHFLKLLCCKLSTKPCRCKCILSMDSCMHEHSEDSLQSSQSAHQVPQLCWVCWNKQYCCTNKCEHHADT